MMRDVTPVMIKSRRQSLIIYADTAPVMFCLSPEENRNQKKQLTATAAASYLDILNWEKSALPTVTTVAREKRSKGGSRLLTSLLIGGTSVLKQSWMETEMNYLLDLVTRSIQTTKRIKKATTSQRTTKVSKSQTRATLQFSDQLVFATTTSKKQTTTTQRRKFQNQRYASKRPSSNQGIDNLFSGALLITTPSVISQPFSTTSTTIKKKLATTKLPKINIQNAKKASTVSPQPHFNKPEANAPDTKDRLWSK